MTFPKFLSFLGNFKKYFWGILLKLGKFVKVKKNLRIFETILEKIRKILGKLGKK